MAENNKKNKKNVKQKNNPNDNEKEKTVGLSKRRLLLSSLLLLLSLGSYKLYEAVTHVPDLPELDQNAWWGDEALKSNQTTSVRPYKILFAESMLEQLYRKLDHFSRRHYAEGAPKSFEGTAWRYGVNHGSLETVITELKYRYNFRRREKFLNQYDHFVTNIQGLDIHFVHVKPQVEKNVQVLPILLLHGWPSTFRDFYEVIPKLTTQQQGYDFVFELIIPSLPGFAFSEAARKPGLGPINSAVIMNNLMQRLGFNQYYIHGGDFGQLIGSHMATLYPKQVLGYHTNFGANLSRFSVLTWILGAVWPTLVEDVYTSRMYPLSKLMSFYWEEFGYMHIQGTKPDTIGIALQDSLVGLVGYVLDRQMVFTDLNNRDKPDGGVSTLNLEKFLDNIILFWSSGSITSANRMYAESFADFENEQIFGRIPTPVPTWILRFKHEVTHTPDFMLRWKYPNLVGVTNHEFGGHFAPFERPEEVSSNLFEATKMFLEYKAGDKLKKK